ncbi:MAG: hypothetical protein ACKE51_02520 [Methylococcaceae bacterium]
MEQNYIFNGYLVMKWLRRGIAIFTVLISSFTPLSVWGRGPMPGVTSDSKFVIYYGDNYYTNSGSGVPEANWTLNVATINALAQFEVVVLQPNQPHFRPEVVHALKERGVDVVLGYISIGEDFINKSVEGPLSGGSGFLVYDSNTETLVPSLGNTLQSFYMDVDTQTVSYDLEGNINAVQTDQRLVPDNLPDYNPNFLGYMINPDSHWRWVIDNMRIGSSNVFGRTRKAGLKQLSGIRDINALRTQSANFGFDGFFLDTIDTAGPYDNPGWYPWVIENMRDTVKYISDTYPSKVVFSNRGTFYYSAGLISPVTGQYPIDFTIRSYVNAILFESFRYDSNPVVDGLGGVNERYNDYRYNIAPKVLAEANRIDGFTVFSLEYESGRFNIADDAFDTDIRQFGFTGYLADNEALDTINLEFLNRLPDSANDISAPTWDTTGHTAYNTATSDFRVGVQYVSQGSVTGEAIVHWDIAIDQSSPVSYDVLVTDVASGATAIHSQVVIEPSVEWAHDPVNHSANQYTVNNLVMDRLYKFKVIARDTLGNQNAEDAGLEYYLTQAISNPILSTAINFDGLLTEWGSLSGLASDPDDISGVSLVGHVSGAGNQANWRQIQVAHTTDTAMLFLAYTNQTNIYVSWGFQVFIDADDNLKTGFQGGFGGIINFPIGADYLIEGVNVYQYNGGVAGTDWMWIKSRASAGFEIGRNWNGATGEVFLPLSWIGNPTSSISFVLFGNNGFYGHEGEYDWYPNNAINGGVFRYEF